MRGDLQSISFRAPREVVDKLDAYLAGHPEGIISRTEAMQDALVCWLLMEGVE